MSQRPARPPLQCDCEARSFRRVFVYDRPPAGETRFEFTKGAYRREVWRCDICRHFVSRHEMDTTHMYSAQYMDSTYGSEGIRAAFERIIGLPTDRSDNAARARRVVEHARGLSIGPTPRILDVGSGLCVFLHAMKLAGWSCTALDPDERAARHARQVVGIEAVHGDFMEVELSRRFDVVTFNKVLEHVEDPVAMLARSLRLLAPGGFAYVEVPDGERAAEDGQGREEFFIDHPHVFSAASLALLAVRAGYSPRRIERIREPSDKHTLYALLEATG